MIVAAFQAYLLLPNRVAGSMHPPSSTYMPRRPSGGSEGTAAATDQAPEVYSSEDIDIEEEDFEPTLSFSEGPAFQSLLEVPLYYRSRHFMRASDHSYTAWDDCMWLLMLQETSRGSEDCCECNEDGNRDTTAFGLFERELLLMKPFLMFCGVFAGMIATTNKSYMDVEYSEMIRGIAEGAGFRFVSSAGLGGKHRPVYSR